MAQHRVAVTDDRFHSPYDLERDILREADAELELLQIESEAEAPEALGSMDGLLVNHFAVSASVLRRMKRCRIVSRYGTGYDNVDVQEATRAGIWVANVPDYATEDVSDHALALLLGCARKLVYRDRRIREGGWYLFSEQKCSRIRGKALGIVGYGRIGRAFHRKVKGLGLAAVLVSDPYVDPPFIRSQGASPVGLPELLARSDYVSLHASLTEETRGLIGEQELAVMREGAILINTARGPIVKEEALVARLESGALGYAGLDVYQKEPLAPKHPLRKLENVILSDHAAWYTEESEAEMRSKAARNVLAVLKGGRPLYPVNDVPLGR
jgi:D-3-phosphoglycerate dehydrogenase